VTTQLDMGVDDMIRTGRSRRIRSLVAIGVAAMLIAGIAGPATAKSHDIVIPLPFIGGWYGAPESGQIVFRSVPDPTTATAGSYRERISTVTCSGTGGFYGIEPGSTLPASTAVVPFSVFTTNSPAGTVISCTATYERDTATCIFGVCLFDGAYESFGGTEIASATIKVDTTSPILSPPQPSGLPNALGWYRTSGTVDWSGSDSLSGIYECATDVPFGGTDTATGQVTGGCTNNAGRISSSAFQFKFDGTPPALAPTVQPGVVTVGGAATASANATDATSGVATQGCDPVDTSAVGTHTVSCTATDNAGNTATASASYTVAYGFSGFSAPVNAGAVNVANAGRTVPLKWRVTDGSGAPVTTLTSVDIRATGVACDLGETVDQVEAYATDAAGLRHLGDGYYQFNWKTPKSYAASCKVLHLDLGDGIEHTAEFRFTK
jgi:hypothetical protein